MIAALLQLRAWIAARRAKARALRAAGMCETCRENPAVPGIGVCSDCWLERQW